MKKEDKIRNRKSYKRFAAILEVLESDEIIEKKMLIVFVHMNDMYAFGSAKNAKYGLESLQLLLKDNSK